MLDAGGLLLAEAGTGTGKTLAYLLPAVELGAASSSPPARRTSRSSSSRRTSRSSRTPSAATLNVAVMKGRANYLCLLRFSSFAKAGSFRRLEEIPIYRAVEAWAPETPTGDRAEVADLPDSVDFWREISAASENCIGQSCSLFDSCFVTRMRQRALEADLVVVNHHLLCADLAVKDGSYGQVIPAYDTLVLDEAHLIEDVATQYFGVHVSSHRVEDLARDVERELKAAKLDARDVRAEVEGVRLRADRLFGLLSRGRVGRLGPGWMTTRSPRSRSASCCASRACRPRSSPCPTGRRPSPASPAAPSPSPASSRSSCGPRPTTTSTSSRRAAAASSCGPCRSTSSGRLKELLFDEVRAAVLTSATLAVDGGFDYLKDRLGLEPTDELLLASPFRYEEQAVLYVPRGMPEPQSPDVRGPRGRGDACGSSSSRRGRAFVLFTSYANMNAVAERIAGRVDYPLLIQGEAPKARSSTPSASTPHAVLLATASFWQGVDVAGEQLSCVIIDKLPFASPGDPVVSARIERLRNRGQERLRRVPGAGGRSSC